MRVHVAIIGSGPCGLGAAWRLERLRESGATPSSYVVIEKNGGPGGQAASFSTTQGFTFDYGSHILYPHERYSQFKDLLSDLVPQWYESLPVRGVWTDRRLVPYPIQQNIHRLPFAKMLPSLWGLWKASAKTSNGSAPDFESYLRRRFGDQLTRLVLGPLNRKMWAYEPALLDSVWTGHQSGSRTQNVADSDMRQILRSLLTRRDNPGWSDASPVRYPLNGGTGSIWDSLARRLPLERLLYNTSVADIDPVAKCLGLACGARVHYDHLISTMPLDALLRMMARSGLNRLANHLRFSRALLLGFGLRGSPPSRLARVHSFHTPDDDIPCWRISIPSNYSPGNAPADHWSLLCEVSDSGTEPFDVSACAAHIESKIDEYGFLARSQGIVSRWSATLQYGYPVPFLGRDRILRQIHRALRRFGVLSRGRFGGWKYEVSNQDHAFMQGVEAIDHLVSQTPETTYLFPSIVNEAQ